MVEGGVGSRGWGIGGRSTATGSGSAWVRPACVSTRLTLLLAVITEQGSPPHARGPSGVCGGQGRRPGTTPACAGTT
ncbi:hypothetical protein C0Q64_21540 [Streptomyces albidoflavus]|nr:hypothetical protein C0Q64_21540 [Streptomyces albidoflavus]RZD98761.1 hypothetical protein C0Q65_21775 [Streptomyces albidoflavus]